MASTPASALLCSAADPAIIPGGTGSSFPADVINAVFLQSGRNTPQTLSYVPGSTAYQFTTTTPFITGRTFVYDPSQPQAGAAGSFLLPLAQLRGLTQAQYLNFWALPNTPPTPRNNAIALAVVPPGTTLWSGIAGPITDANGNFWGGGGGTQYFVGSEIRPRQIPVSYFLFPTSGAPGPVLVYGPRLSANAGAIGGYLDQRCVAAYSDLDRVLTSLDVLNLANPTNAGPLAAAVDQLSPDRYGALPLIIGRQQTLVLDAFGGRIDATRWPFGDPQVHQQLIAPGLVAWGRMLGDFGQRDDTSTMPGYRTTTAGGLGGVGFENGDFVFGIGAGYLSSNVTWRDLGSSAGNVATGVLGAYGGAAFGALLIDGTVAGTYSSINVRRQIVIPDAGLGIPGLSTAIYRTANGTTQAAGVAGRLDFGTKLRFDQFAVKPFAGLSFGWLDRQGFTETDAGAVDLAVIGQTSDGLRSRLGAVASYDLAVLGPFGWALQGDLVWTHRLLASSGDITAGLINQPGSFTIQTVRDDQDSLQPGLAIIGRGAGGNIYVRYDGDFRQDFCAHALTGGALLKF